MFISACDINKEDIPEFSSSATGPFYINTEHLELIKQNRKDPLIEGEIGRIVDFANQVQIEDFKYVTDKMHIPPSGDIHDYMSVAPLLWPDSTGAFTIQRDGQRNPILYEYDRPKLADLSFAVYALSLAYYYEENPEYAEKASKLLYNWFLNKNTRMNPNLNYAQVALNTDRIRGMDQGIIDANDFIRMIEASHFIYDSPFWTPSRHTELKSWFFEFSRWILSNTNPDNHCSEVWCSNISTWFDAQKTIYFLFIEQEDRLNNASYIQPIDEKLALQFTDIGVQTSERVRTESQHYFYFNLRGHMKIASMRKKRSEFDRDWKTLNTPNYGRLKPSIDAIVDYLNGEDASDFFTVSQSFDNCRYLEVLKPAAVVFDSIEYEEASLNLINSGCRDPLILLAYPKLDWLNASESSP